MAGASRATTESMVVKVRGASQGGSCRGRRLMIGERTKARSAVVISPVNQVSLSG